QEIVHFASAVLERQLDVIEPGGLERPDARCGEADAGSDEIDVEAQLARFRDDELQVIARERLTAGQPELNGSERTCLAQDADPVRRLELPSDACEIGRVVAEHAVQGAAIGQLKQQPQRWAGSGLRSGKHAPEARPGPPLWLLLELTYRCPLHCVFCYNPTEFARTGAELATADWIRVLREARALGAVQLGLSGGEPLVREDLEELVAEAHALGFYINLITSGVGMTEPRIKALKLAGLDHIQLSFQDSTRQMNDFLSSTRTFELKEKVAALIRGHGYPMVLNVVLHRLNIDHVGEILAMAERMGAQYV